MCEGAEGMTEPLKQCTAWLRAYFCEPARTEQLPVPPFHHPLLQQGQCHPDTMLLAPLALLLGHGGTNDAVQLLPRAGWEV